MVYIRRCNKLYERIPFNVLHQLEQRIISIAAVSCHVDGSSILREIKYEDRTDIFIKPNEIYNPSNRQNKSWDRIIVMEAFPQKLENRRRCLLPVFINYKFCVDFSTFELSKGEVFADLKNCLDFFNEYVRINNTECRFISQIRK